MIDDVMTYLAAHEALFLTVVAAVKAVAAFGIALTAVPVLVLAERKLIGYIQQRPGPNRVGPWGVLQPFVDGLKLFLKEDMVPRGADLALFLLAPAFVLAIATLTLCAVPIGPEITLAGESWRLTTSLSVVDLDTGLLYVFAVGSLGVYGIILGGWASNNKYSLMGALRSSAQLISYELPMGLAVVGVLLMAGTFNLSEIAEQQSGGFWNWFVWRQPIGFLLFFIAGIAETNRLPFDLAEGESELTGGFHTEYSSMKFAFYFMAEYVNMVIFAVVTSTLFLGGWAAPIPFLGAEHFFGLDMAAKLGPNGFAIWTAANAAFWTGAKVAAFAFFFIFLRGTLPRLRYDQLMNLGWKIMMPGAFINLALTAVVLALVAEGVAQAALLAVLGFAVILLADAVVVARRRRLLQYDIRVS